MVDQVVDEPQLNLDHNVDVNKIMHAHKFATLFKKKAYDPSYAKDIRKQYLYHKKEANRLKKILAKIGKQMMKNSDSEDSSADSGYDHIGQKAMGEYMNT